MPMNSEEELITLVVQYALASFLAHSHICLRGLIHTMETFVATVVMIILDEDKLECTFWVRTEQNVLSHSIGNLFMVYFSSHFS